MTSQTNKRRLTAFFVVLVMLLNIAFQFEVLHAGTSAFPTMPAGAGGGGGGGGELGPRGFSVKNGTDHQWLESKYNNNFFMAIYTGETNGKNEVMIDENTKFYAWVDKNPTVVADYIVLYEDGSPVSISVGTADRSSLVDPSGQSSRWSIPITYNNFKANSHYEFAFLRGLKANNGVTCVLIPDTEDSSTYSGYLQSPSSAEETALYDAHKNDEYRYREYAQKYDTSSTLSSPTYVDTNAEGTFYDMRFSFTAKLPPVPTSCTLSINALSGVINDWTADTGNTLKYAIVDTDPATIINGFTSGTESVKETKVNTDLSITLSSTKPTLTSADKDKFVVVAEISSAGYLIKIGSLKYLTAFAGTIAFPTQPAGSSGGAGGGGEIGPRGFSAKTDSEHKWLESKYNNDFFMAAYTGTTNGKNEVIVDEDTQFFAWIDKNPSTVTDYIVLYEDGVKIPNFSQYVGTPVRDSTLDPSGQTNRFRVPITFNNYKQNSRYEFAFLRGIKANNGVTCVLSPDPYDTTKYIGYLQSPSGEALDLYNAHQYDEFKFRQYEKTYNLSSSTTSPTYVDTNDEGTLYDMRFSFTAKKPVPIIPTRGAVNINSSDIITPWAVTQGNTIKYALLTNNPATKVAGYINGTTEVTETIINTDLSTTLGAKPTLTAADKDKYLIAVELNSKNKVVKVGCIKYTDPIIPISANVSVASNGNISTWTLTSGNTLVYALLSADPTTTIDGYTSGTSTVLTSTVNTGLGVTLGNRPTLSANESEKFVLVAEVDYNNVVIKIGFAKFVFQSTTPTAVIPTLGTVNIDSQGVISIWSVGSSSTVKYALVSDNPSTRINSYTSGSTSITETTVNSDFSTTLSNTKPVLTDADNNKYVLAVEMDSSGNVIKIGFKKYNLGIPGTVAFPVKPSGTGGAGTGNEEVAPRGFSVQTDSGHSWLESKYNNEFFNAIYTGVTNGTNEVVINNNTKFYAWIDKNPTVVKDFIALYEDGVKVPNFEQYVSTTVRDSFADPSGYTNRFRVEITFKNFKNGSKYEFAFLRGIKANNGVTCVLVPDPNDSSKYVGYLQNPTVEEALELYNKHSSDEYKYRQYKEVYDLTSSKTNPSYVASNDEGRFYDMRFSFTAKKLTIPTHGSVRIDNTGHITDWTPRIGNTLKFALLSSNPATKILEYTTGNAEISETKVNTDLGITLGAKPTLTEADLDKFLLVAEIDHTGNVVEIGSDRYTLDTGVIIPQLSTVAISNEGDITDWEPSGDNVKLYALMQANPTETVNSYINGSTTVTETDVNEHFGIELGEKPILTARDANKYLLVTEINIHGEIVKIGYARFNFVPINIPVRGSVTISNSGIISNWTVKTGNELKYALIVKDPLTIINSYINGTKGVTESKVNIDFAVSLAEKPQLSSADKNKYVLVAEIDEEGFVTKIGYAKYIISTDSGSSGGNSGGGSGNNTSNTNTNQPATTNSPKVDVGNSTVTISAKADPKSNNKGIDINSKTITDALKALAAEKAENTNSILNIKVEAGESDNSVTISIPKSAIDTLAKNGSITSQIETPFGTISLDNSVLSVLSKNADSKINITITLVDLATITDNESLTDEIKSKIGDRPIININITSGNKTFSSFNGESVKISIPYSLREGENPDNLVIFYINDSGNLQLIQNCAFDEKTNQAVFSTNHLSMYAIGLEERTFDDVSEDAPFKNNVDFVVARGLLNGTDARIFSPFGVVTNAMAITILGRLSGYPISKTENQPYYEPYLKWAVTNNFISPTNADNFEPNVAITREELAIIIDKFLTKNGVVLKAENMEFSDKNAISPEALDAVIKLTGSNVLDVKSNNEFLPQGEITRIEMTSITKRLIELMINE